MSKKKQVRCTETIDIEDLIAAKVAGENHLPDETEIERYDRMLAEYRKRKPEPIYISIHPPRSDDSLIWTVAKIIAVAFVAVSVLRVAIHTFSNL